MILLTDALLASGQFRECIKVAEETLSWARRTGVHLYDAELLRINAAAVLALSPDSDRAQSDAANLLSQSLAAARASAARSWELRTATDLSELWGRQGRKDAALNLLEEVLGRFTEGNETYDLRRARELLNALS
jgi:hypothetical protein